MNLHALSCVTAVLAAAMCPLASADLSLPVVFSDGMVLQRELPVPIWGNAVPGERVTVTFSGQSHTAVADAKGAWMVVLEPLATSTEGQTLTVRGTTRAAFNDVLVGEVWLCSGQSNMAGKFVEAKGRRIDPKVFERDLSGFRFLPPNGAWRTLDERSQNQLSCVAFHFGIELYRELGIPIGLIQRYNSGTPIQAWMPVDACELIRTRLGIPADWNDPAPNRNPGVQFEAKLDPIIPVAFRGAIWYQGERNAKSETGYEYRWLLPHLIETWRDLWTRRAGTPPRPFPFYYVQVPTQAAAGEWPWLRDGMRRALRVTENTGMAVFYDHGPSLHPKNKQPAGERLALWALANDYGHTDLVHCGPLLDEVHIEDGKAILSFTHVGSGLRSAEGGNDLRFFEIAGADAAYVSANARIEGDTVAVWSADVRSPVHVRYLFRKPEPDPTVSLINAEGLPASSFITDDMKPARDATE